MKELNVNAPVSSEHIITSIEVTSGAPIPALDYLKVFNADSWEDLTLELVSHWKTQYSRVMRCGAGGDMGRDVIAYRHDEPGSWENYQCKHYSKRLSLSLALLEIGKILYYVYQGEFTLPQRYYFVAPQGLSNDLLKHLNDPARLKNALIDKWASACKSKITSKNNDDIALDGEFLKFVQVIDFSIFDHIPPMKIIELHSNTVFHAQRFGINVRKRSRLPIPPEELTDNEIVYTKELLRAFANAEQKENLTVNDLEEGSDYKCEYEGARRNFYAAENLQKFSRDWLPDNSYAELTDECYEAVSGTLRQKHDNGYERYLATSSQAAAINYTSHPLSPYIKTQDKKGMCHQLVNTSLFKWVREERR
ncbi:MAG: hypothetical protein RBR82_08855 [Pseudomonas sp.]|nr:hypothetical protein [Pseudomonas sp.]